MEMICLISLFLLPSMAMAENSSAIAGSADLANASDQTPWSGIDDYVTYSQPQANNGISMAFPVINLSRDNAADFLVLNISSDSSNSALRSEISAFSGEDGRVLWEKDFPDALAFATPAGDLNGDGRTDVVVDVILAGTQFIPYSSVTALDGESGEEIWSRPQMLAATLAYPTMDTTGDNVTELLAHVFGIDSLNGTVATKIIQIDGASGSDLGSRIFTGAIALEYPGGNLTSDRTTDGLTVAYELNETSQNITTVILATDGSNHETIWKIALDGLALAVPIEDLTGDGRDDLVMYLMNLTEDGISSEIGVVQGSSGKMLWRTPSGRSLAIAMLGPDLTGDGRKDLIVYRLGESEDSEVAAIKGDDGTLLWSKKGTVLLPQ